MVRGGSVSRPGCKPSRRFVAYPTQVHAMIKFLGKTAFVIFLIGLAVVIGLLMLIF